MDVRKIGRVVIDLIMQRLPTRHERQTSLLHKDYVLMMESNSAFYNLEDI